MTGNAVGEGEVDGAALPRLGVGREGEVLLQEGSAREEPGAHLGGSGAAREECQEVLACWVESLKIYSRVRLI